MVAFVELAKRVIGAAGSLAFGRLFLREPLTGEKLVGIAVLCTGITLIMFA
jgi:multidrug transporter EmrE-like cation transporter